VSRWFRFHADAMRNPKVARLNDMQFRLWIELLSVAAENDGAIPCLDDLKHILKRRLDHLSRGLDDLIRAGLMDVLGDGYEPHNWGKNQYKSDVSTSRVQKYRAKGNVSETPPDTETETDTEDVVAKATTSPRAKRAAAGTRIDPNWIPSDLPPNVADLAAQWPPGRVQRELDGFRDYWKARTRDAARSDWNAVWHNRIRDQHDRIIRENRNGNGISKTHSGAADKRDGAIKALDRRLGFDDTAGPFGRYDAGPSDSHIALPAPSLRSVR
jgi:hypothetical protein